jgi:hypothetical protein
MKYLIIITLLFGLGCKKEKADRNIEVIGYYYDCSYYLSNGRWTTTSGIKKGKSETFTIEGNIEASISVTSIRKGNAWKNIPDTANDGFRLVIVSNSKTIYDAYGSNHHYKF